MALRRVVATAWKFGKAATAFSIIFSKLRGVEGREVLVEPLDLEAEGGREVLLVAEHHVDVGASSRFDLLRALLAADRLPQRGAVVEVVGDDRAVLLRRRHGLLGDERRRLGEGGEDPAGVEPARAVPAEERVPVDVARLHLRGGGVAAVGAADGGAHAEAALGEVEAVADRAPDAVVGHQAHVGLVDAALVDEVLRAAGPPGCPRGR